jgi:hypothetical protein
VGIVAPTPVTVAVPTEDPSAPLTASERPVTVAIPVEETVVANIVAVNQLSVSGTSGTNTGPPITSSFTVS